MIPRLDSVWPIRAVSFISRKWQAIAISIPPPIAMACHFRLMKETARMGQTESNLGIIPGYGGTQRLPRLIGRTKALEFLILGTQIPAPECLQLRLVNRLCKES